MSEKNKAVVRRNYEEVWNAGNVGAIDDIYAANLKPHFLPPELPQDIEGFKMFFHAYRAAFPDVHFVVEEQFADGETVVTRWRFSGTHQGELMGIPATGNQAEFSGISIHKLAGGQIVEDWVEYDQFGMMVQLGVIPVP
jgi:steroid delta-isomerase-like uncharacterized protein